VKECNRPVVREMRAGDVPDVLGMMKELAQFEGKTSFKISEADLVRWCSGELCQFGVLVVQADQPDATGMLPLAGYAAYYSVPFKDDVRPALMLKGLYVKGGHRRQGIGRSLFARVAEIAKEKDCGRLQWFVLRTNGNAQTFYGSCGAAPDLAWERWGFDLARLTAEPGTGK
jgi:GNAT superfamily N-acetyltransferase